MTKNWDDYVVQAEEIARSAGFAALRDRIIDLALPCAHERCVDVGSGTGLLTLPFAARVEHILAVDISPAMCGYLRAKVASAGLENVEIIVTSAGSLPLVDASVDLVVSNYCFHHLDHLGKERALAETFRVLRPGGRLVFADMMFAMTVTDARDRRVIASKVRAMLQKGPAGVIRLARNAARLAGGTWEKPARPQWWAGALARAGFEQVHVVGLDHEGGIAVARKP